MEKIVTNKNKLPYNVVKDYIRELFVMKIVVVKFPKLLSPIIRRIFKIKSKNK